jgi:hypothetical protein
MCITATAHGDLAFDRRRARPACVTVAAFAGVRMAEPSLAQDTEARIQRLEGQLKALARERQALKQQARKTPAPASPSALDTATSKPADPAAAAQKTASPVFAEIGPRNPFGWGPGTGWGALELGLRYSFWDAADFTPSHAPPTGGLGATSGGVSPSVTRSTNKANAATLALKWLLNCYVALMGNYVHTRFDAPIVANGITLDDGQASIRRAQSDFY